MLAAKISKIKKFHYAWIILLAVALIRGVAGPALNASSGLFLNPVSSELGVGIGSLSLYLSLSAIILIFCLPIAGNILNKYNLKAVAVGAILIYTLAFMSLGFMNSVWGWYIMSFPLTFGAVILVNLLGPVLVNRWFATNKGLVMGLMMTITSLLGAVFQPTMSSMIDTSGWRFTYQAFGIFALVFMVIVAVALLRYSPEEVNTKPFGYEKANLENAEQAQGSKFGVSAGVALKARAFFLLLIFMIVITGFAAFSQHVATFGVDSGLAMSTVGKALSLSMIGSALGAILIGVLSDRVGVIPTTMGVLAIALGAIVLFLMSNGTFTLFAMATFLHGMASASIGVLAPLLVSKFFGSKDYEKIYSTVMIGAPLASIILLPGYGFVFDTFGSYSPVFFFLMVAIGIATISVLAGYKNSKKILADAQAEQV